MSTQGHNTVVLEMAIFQSKVDHSFTDCLFDLILYIPVNKFSVKSGRVFLG